MAKWVGIRIDYTLVAQQVLSELISHGPLQCKKLQLHGAIVDHVALLGPQTSAGVSYGLHLTTLFL